VKTVDDNSSESGPSERPSLLGDLANKLQGGLLATLDALRQSHAQRLAAIVESSDDAIISVDLDGTIATWNSAAQKLFGYSADDVIGGPVTTLIPPERHGEEFEILARVRRGEGTAHYKTQRCRNDGHLVDISLTVSPIKDAAGTIIGASKIARDISEHEHALKSLAQKMDEQAALYEFTSNLFRATSLNEIYNAALDAITRALGCERASILMFDGKGVMKFVAWRGLSDDYRHAVEGHSPWTRDVETPQPIVLADVAVADLDAGLKATVKTEGIRALAFIPLTAKGELIGKFMTYYNVPHEFTNVEMSLALTIARQLGFAVERFRAEESKALLLAETQHRIKNSLATVQAFAGQTLRHSPPAELEAFLARLRALGEAHELLSSEKWDQAPLVDVVERALKPFGEHFIIEGPGVSLPAKTSLTLTMCLHELATNAAKYGALSNGSGKVHVAWELLGNSAERKVGLTWTETGGPPIIAPKRTGFGSLLIQQSFGPDRGTCFDYRPTGLICALELPL
jgi:PAS domain S-box-containing protein